MWPRPGRCGACGHPAVAFPSGNWEHRGRPCLVRYQTLWRTDDVSIRSAVRFIPDGEPLPTAPDKPHWHPLWPDPHGVPTALGWCTTDHLPSIREWLAHEADIREPP